jgi:hypothetical protein
MTTTMRRYLGLAGGIVLGIAVGNAADAAGITPNYDGDMGIYGFFAGIGFGLTVLARVRGDKE